jgi:hypothetical protein
VLLRPSSVVIARSPPPVVVLKAIIPGPDRPPTKLSLALTNGIPPGFCDVLITRGFDI